jgi:tetratricopeptide (TPR) repeat protein
MRFLQLIRTSLQARIHKFDLDSGNKQEVLLTFQGYLTSVQMRLFLLITLVFTALLQAVAQGPVSPDSIMADGRRKMNERDFIGAIRDFNRVIRSNSNYVEAFVARAQAKFNMADYDAARLDAQKSIELKPNLEEAHFILGEISLAQQKYTDALPEFNKTLEINLNNSEAFRGKVFSIYFSGKEKEASELVETAIAKDPQKSINYYIKGVLNINKGKYSRALENFDKALSLNTGTNEFNIYLNRGVAYLELEETDAALKDITKAIELGPNNASAYHSRGRIYYSTKQYSEAVKDFSRSVEINPNNDAAYYNLGMTYFRLEDNKNACENFHKSCSLGNKNACKMIIMNCTGSQPKVK